MKGYAALRSTLIAETDVLVRTTERRGNVLHGLNYIPGSSLRGHLAFRWLKSGVPDDNFRRLFQSGEVRFENAYPLVGQEQSWPVPFSLSACKSHRFEPDHLAADLALTNERITCTALSHGEDSGTLKRVRGFIAKTGVVRESDTMVTRHRIGTASDGSGLAQEGQLFTEVRIPAGTRFRAEIRGPKDLVESLMTLLETSEPISVGRSRSLMGQLANDGWQTDDEGVQIADSAQTHTLTLLSDAVLLDGYQRGLTDIESLLDGAVNMGESDGSIDIKAAFVRTVTVGGWDALNDLPKPVDTALAAGSVISFTASPGFLDRLGDIPGIGWRQSEGFGRFAIDWPIHRMTSFSREEMVPPAPTTNDRREQVARYAEQLAPNLVNVGVNFATWRGLEGLLRLGRTFEEVHDRPSSHLQAAAGRGTGAGNVFRERRSRAHKVYEQALMQMNIRPGSHEALMLADDVGEELKLLAAERANR